MDGRMESMFIWPRIVKVREVPGKGAVSVHGSGAWFMSFLVNRGMNSRTGVVGSLPVPEDVEVTQPDAGHAVDPGKDVRIKLIHVFGDEQGERELPDLILHFG